MPSSSFRVVKTWREFLPSPANSFIVSTNRGLLVFDAGADPAAKILIGELGGEEAIVLITHYHWDHSVGIVGLVAEGYSVYAPRRTIEILSDPDTVLKRVRLITRIAGLGNVPVAEYYTSLYDGINRVVEHIEPLDETILGEYNVMPIHCPGHTEDHYCYIVNDMLVTGDLITPTGSTETINAKDYVKSIMRLLELEWRLLLPGHGDPLKRANAVEVLRRAMERKLTRFRTLCMILGERGSLPAPVLLRELYGGPPSSPFIAFDRAYSLLGYLRPLEERGLVELIERDGMFWVEVKDRDEVRETTL